MKILFVTREGCALAGARVRCYNFARELAKLGLETEVFSFAEALGAPCGEGELSMGGARKLAYTLKAVRRLQDMSRGAVFYIQRFNYHSFAPLLVSIMRRNKVIFDCDDWNIREDPKYYWGMYPSSKMEYCTRRMARYACVCVAASAFLKEYLGKFNPRVYYIPTGVDTDFFKPPEKIKKNNTVRFSWIGTVYHEEMRDNLYFALDCFSQLASRLGNITLSIAGEGRYFGEIKARAAQSPFKDRIAVDGWIHPDRIPEYLADIDVGLLPLIQDMKFNRAKSPTKLFEYMAMAKPSVCSAIGEAQRIVSDGENGMLARSKEEFTGKMKVLAENPELRLVLGERARRAAERDYSLGVLAERLRVILKDVCL